MAPNSDDAIARQLEDAGYVGLFLAGSSSAASAVWRDGESRPALERIAGGDAFGALPRVLAAELLRRERDGGGPWLPPATLARVYTDALELTGISDAPTSLSGNEWGLMYLGDDEGQLGAGLIEAGPAALPHLEALLGDDRRLFYVGSKEATVGNALAYRVKDAAAYYLGRIAGIAVAFHEEAAERDAEIERLRAELARRRREGLRS